MPLGLADRIRQSSLARWISRKAQNGAIQLRYLLGDDTPARRFLSQYKETATQQPVSGHLGGLRGHGSQTVVVDFNLAYECSSNSPWRGGNLVLKFEAWPGVIPQRRLAAECRNERLARAYLDRFMPTTLRVIGHGLRNEPSAMTYQQRVQGKPLRLVLWSAIASNSVLSRELVEFCDAILTMSRETGRIPDLAGTLPHIDHLSNLFWRSRNIVVDIDSNRVWLVDTGWKDGEESLREGRLRSRLRTWFRLQTMRLFRWRIVRWVEKGGLYRSYSKGEREREGGRETRAQGDR